MIHFDEVNGIRTITLNELFLMRSPVERKKYNGRFLIDHKIVEVSNNVEAQSLIVFCLKTETSYKVSMFLPKNKKNLEGILRDQGDTLLTFETFSEKVHFHGSKIDNDEDLKISQERYQARQERKATKAKQSSDQGAGLLRMGEDK